MKKYSIEEIKAQYLLNNYKWFTDINFVGIRSNADLPNVFDDLFGVINNDKITETKVTIPDPINPIIINVRSNGNPKI